MHAYGAVGVEVAQESHHGAGEDQIGEIFGEAGQCLPEVPLCHFWIDQHEGGRGRVEEGEVFLFAVLLSAAVGT